MAAGFAYLPYLILAENVTTLGLQALIIFFFGRLVLNACFCGARLSVRRFSSSFGLYVGSHLVGTLLAMPYILYLLLGWSVRPENYCYNPYVVFWTGIAFQAYLTCTPVPLIFLTLDRCMVLNYSHMRYGNWRKKIFATSVACYFGCVAGAIFFATKELPFNERAGKLCGTFTCLQSKYKTIPQLYQKLACLTFDFALSVYFLCLLHAKAAALNIKDRIVKTTVVLEFIFATIPQCINLTVNTTTGRQISDYLGTYLSVMCFVETAACSAIYSTLFLAHKGATHNAPHNSSSFGSKRVRAAQHTLTDA